VVIFGGTEVVFLTCLERQLKMMVVSVL